MWTKTKVNAIPSNSKSKELLKHYEFSKKKMKSKYLGKTYGNYKVINYYKKADYKNKYINDKPYTYHNTYTYILINLKDKVTLSLSGNTLRLIDKGLKTIDTVIEGKVFQYKNNMRIKSNYILEI